MFGLMKLAGILLSAWGVWSFVYANKTSTPFLGISRNGVLWFYGNNVG